MIIHWGCKSIYRPLYYPFRSLYDSRQQCKLLNIVRNKATLQYSTSVCPSVCNANLTKPDCSIVFFILLHHWRLDYGQCVFLQLKLTLEVYIRIVGGKVWTLHVNHRLPKLISKRMGEHFLNLGASII